MDGEPFLPILSSLTLSAEPSIHFVQTQAADQASDSLWPDGTGRFWRWLHGEHGSHWALGRPSVRCGKQIWLIAGMSVPICPHNSREISHSPPRCPEYNVFLDLSLPSQWGVRYISKEQRTELYSIPGSPNGLVLQVGVESLGHDLRSVRLQA